MNKNFISLLHGALGVTLTAMLTCAEFVGQEYLAKKVGNA